MLLPAPFGPIRPTISPARDLEADVVDRDQAAEALDRAVDRQERRAARRAARDAAAAGARRCAVARAGDAADQRATKAMMPPRAHCSSRMNSTAKTTISSWPGALREQRQHVLHAVLQQHDDAPRRPSRRAGMPEAADHRHQQILDAVRTSNGDGLTKRFMCA